MFAHEESSQSKSLKRQEDAKERRRRLKQQITKDKNEGHHRNHNETQNSNISTSKATSNTNESSTLKLNETISKSNNSDIKSTASSVEVALQQRKLRIQQKHEMENAIKIQSVIRSHQVRQSVHQDHLKLLQKRLNDVQKVIQILGKQDKVYVSPPAVTMSLLNQLLFTSYIPFTKTNTIGGKTHSSRILKDLTKEHGKMTIDLLQYVILPSVTTQDPHMNIAELWFIQGSFESLRRLLRLCCHLIFGRQVRYSKGEKKEKLKHYGSFLLEEQDTDVMYTFLSTILKKEESYYSFRNARMCHDILLPEKGETSNHDDVDDCQDLIELLRRFLLYPKKTKIHVIPASAEHLREKCVDDADRVRATGLLCLVIRHSNNMHLRSRFILEIIGIPLLTWKISKPAFDLLLCKPYDGDTFFLIECIRDFVKSYQVEIKTGRDIFNFRNDVPLNLCPAPLRLRILANMIQLQLKCQSLNGTDQSTFNMKAATTFFDFLSLLIDKVPLGAFSSRHSEIVMIGDGTHLTPVVLSTVIRDQCKAFLIDSNVRNLFRVAVDSDNLNIDEILNRKESADISLEKELEELKTISSISVAAKEAMIDRSSSLWQGSGWAKQLSKKMGSLFGKSNKHRQQMRTENLIDTSSIARDLANGTRTLKERSEQKKDSPTTSVDTQCIQLFFSSLVQTFAIIMSRWGGISNVVNVIFNSQRPKHERVSIDSMAEKVDPMIISILNTLCFSLPIVKILWAKIQSEPSLLAEVTGISDTSKHNIPVRSISLFPKLDNEVLHLNTIQNSRGASFLLLFNATLSHELIVTDDMELHRMEKPLHLHQIRKCILYLKGLMYRIACYDVENDVQVPNNYLGLALISFSSSLLRDLYDRSSRELLCSPKTWLINDLFERNLRESKSYRDYNSLLDRPILQLCPYLVSFKRRLKLFERIISTNRIEIQGSNDGYSSRPGVRVDITRGRVLEDGILHLNKLGRNLRSRIIVQYVNQAGAKESGLDAGGLFKEFWTDLADLAFNPNWALFCETQDSNGFVYPNPSSRAAHGPDSIIMYEFLGRVVGKAMFEGITIKPQFAHFFLSFLRGEYNFLNMLSDLSTMDRTLYNNLMFLKTYEGDASDLCLTFSVTIDDFGTNEEIPLIHGGNELNVTNSNKHRYISLMAKYHVFDRVSEQSEAFRRGLYDVIDRRWMRIFNEPELQVLISGPSDGEIDIEDMKANTRYVGGYTIFDRHVQRFWKIVASFNKNQRADLLRFVTSCERAPPLGFSSINPQFTIQRVPISNDDEKLPTASTCFNILKLPTYSSEKAMRAKLLYAIQSGSGFELT